MKTLAMSFVLGFFPSIALAESFAIEQLPIGAEVTVPATAKTSAPMGSPIKLSSTDVPQTLRIVPIGNGNTFAAPIKLAIFDKHQDRVKYVQVSPSSPFLYSFKGLSTITIQPSLQSEYAKAASAVRMEIESDKPVTLQR